MKCVSKLDIKTDLEIINLKMCFKLVHALCKSKYLFTVHCRLGDPTKCLTWGSIESGRVRSRGSVPCPTGAPVGRAEFHLTLQVTEVAVIPFYLQRPLAYFVPRKPLVARVGVTTINGGGNVMLFDPIVEGSRFAARANDKRKSCDQVVVFCVVITGNVIISG